MLDRTDTDTQDGPSLYQGIALEVEELILSLNVLTRKVRDIKGSFDHRQSVSLKIAADDVSLVAGQMNIIASHLSSVVARYVNRKAVVK